MVELVDRDILNDVEQNEKCAAAAGAIVQNANLDLDLIVSSYTGYARYQRLIYIADHCPPLRVQALSMTLNYLKSETLDVQAYVECHRKLVASAPAGQAPAQDTQWVEATRKLAPAKPGKIGRRIALVKAERHQREHSTGVRTSWLFIFCEWAT
uniref:COP9 signalosome complex subunit 4 n=1 Tax=Macrostomum lignano TaxID=282301 RepID=A0A1I8FIC6_9PLAT